MNRETMKHRDAIEHLPDFRTGVLESDTESSLAAHVENCTACRAWVSSRDLLADQLVGSHVPPEEHPDSASLALSALRPEETLGEDWGDFHAHVEKCSHCQEEVRVLREAIREARPSKQAAPESVAPPPLASRRRYGWLIAALLLTLFALALLAGGSWVGIFNSGEETFERAHLTSEPVTAPGLTRELSGRDLDGKQVIQGERRLDISHLTVKSGANVTFQAGETVAFGDGFQVAPGARITVSSKPSN